MLDEMVTNQVCPKTVPKVQETLTEAQGVRNNKKNFRGFYGKSRILGDFTIKFANCDFATTLLPLGPPLPSSSCKCVFIDSSLSIYMQFTVIDTNWSVGRNLKGILRKIENFRLTILEPS